jgi:hypothetical protein
MKKNTFLLLLCLFFLKSLSLQAQEFKKVMGRPYCYERPEDATISGKPYEEKKRNDAAGWIVISDRNNNATYTGPNSGQEMKKAAFRDYFFVVEQKDNWLHIVKAGETINLELANPASAEDYGWVEKSKMLLWRAALINPNTKIDIKAFLLHKLAEIKETTSGDKDLITIYDGPESGTSLEKRHIFDCFFVYKKENGRYLVGMEVSINPSVIDQILVGWIQQDKLVDWDTRLALEPNFEEDAYNERKSNPAFRINAFNDESSAIDQYDGKELSKGNILMDFDPINAQKKDVSPLDPHRFAGSRFRPPLLGFVNGKYFYSGTVGLLAGNSFSGDVGGVNNAESDMRRRQANASEVDILFVVDGTEQMTPYKEGIKRVMDKFTNIYNGRSVRVGMVLYKKLNDDADDKSIAVKPLTKTVEEVKQFLNNTPFASSDRNQKYTTLYYAIKEGMAQSNMTPDHTNIVVVMGVQGDYRANEIQKEAAKQNNSKTNVKKEAIVDALAALNAHIIGIEAYNNGEEECITFTRQIKSLMLSTAVQQYQGYSATSDQLGLGAKNPEMPEWADDMKENTLVGGSMTGKIVRPSKGASLSVSELERFSTEIGEKINTEIEGVWKAISKLMAGDPSDVRSNGNFGPAVSKILNDMKKNGNSISTLKKLQDEHYKLYIEAYFPTRIQGANYDLMSFVLFMPERDLGDFIATLERLDVAKTEGMDGKRKALYESFVELLRQYTGNTKLKKKPDEFTMNELQQYMQGVKEEGLKLMNPEKSSIFKVKIKDILSEKEMPNPQVNDLVKQISNNLQRLKEIKSKGREYEFSYTSGDQLYFWIPLEYTF